VAVFLSTWCSITENARITRIIGKIVSMAKLLTAFFISRDRRKLISARLYLALFFFSAPNIRMSTEAYSGNTLWACVTDPLFVDFRLYDYWLAGLTGASLTDLRYLATCDLSLFQLSKLQEGMSRNMAQGSLI